MPCVMTFACSGNAPGDVLAIGNFDGVHLGHRAVLHAACARARNENRNVRALTFTPHPCTFFQKDKAPFLLTSPKMRQALLEEAGADSVTILPFTAELASLSPETFVQNVLLKEHAPAHVVVGRDFTFGANRAGTPETLRALLKNSGTGLLEVPPWRDEQDQIISSSRVREAVRAGDPLRARQLLGRPFSIEGVVVHGDARGRLLGVPTANLRLEDYVRPLFGVYAGQARRVGEGKTWPAVINIGIRPTLGGTEEWLEAHLLGFDEMIYDQIWEIALWAFIRPERKFDSLETLKEQINQDIAQTRRFLGTHEEASQQKAFLT